MFDPKEYKANVTPEQQQDDNVYTPPPSGLNIVVNVGLQRNKFSFKLPDENGNFTHFEKLSITSKIVESVKTYKKTDAAKGKKAEGKTFTWDIWSDFTKPSNANRLAAICVACGNEEAFDPSDDESLMNAICGTPYGTEHELKSRVYKDRDGNDKTSHDFNVLVIRPLKDQSMVKKIKADPDFSKLYAAEFKEARDNRKEDGSAAGSNPHTDDGFFDDDLPF